VIALHRTAHRRASSARGKICDRDAVVRALESGQLAGSSLSAQARYLAGTREILECSGVGSRWSGHG
jgi:formate dehydrogenase